MSVKQGNGWPQYLIDWKLPDGQLLFSFLYKGNQLILQMAKYMILLHTYTYLGFVLSTEITCIHNNRQIQFMYDNKHACAYSRAFTVKVLLLTHV